MLLTADSIGPDGVLGVQDVDALQLNCRVWGRPQPVVTWLKDGQILNGSDYRITHARSALDVYSCLHSNVLCPMSFDAKALLYNLYCLISLVSLFKVSDKQCNTPQIETVASATENSL